MASLAAQTKKIATASVSSKKDKTTGNTTTKTTTTPAKSSSGTAATSGWANSARDAVAQANAQIAAAKNKTTSGSTVGNTPASKVSSPSSTSSTGSRPATTTTTTKPAATTTTTTKPASTGTTSSRIYQVGADGKAPAGLKVGDEVVTAGGTYRISGVNPDGTYQSYLANGAVKTDNYKGTYANAVNQNVGTAARDLNGDGYITSYETTGVLGLGQLTGAANQPGRVILQVGNSGKSFISVPAEKAATYQNMLDNARRTGQNISSYNFGGGAYSVSEADAIAAGLETYSTRKYGLTAQSLIGAQVGAGTPNKILADAGLTGTSSWTDPISPGYSWTPNSSGVSTFDGAGYDEAAVRYGAAGDAGSGQGFLQVDASGNAPQNTPVGTVVQTAGGNYLVVPPNTQGASYNPASGLWSIKISEPARTGGAGVTPDGYYSGTGAPGTGYLSNGINNSQGTVVFPNGAGYTPTGSYFDSGMSQADLAAINSLKQAYEAAKARGDTAGMEAAHAQAEAIRAKYGYSGGTDGSEYHAVELPQDQIPMQGLPVYEAQVNPTNNLYDAALQSQTQALQSAYDLNKLELQKYLGEIPPIYQAQANAIAANAEKEKQAMHEMAAANGLNVGTGTQADLALSNQLQNDLGAVRTAQANAINDAQHDLALLYVEYQNSIAQAIADNEYERAAALLAEYQRQAQSVVDVAESQAYLNLDTWGYNQNIKDTQYQRLVENAETLASFGDFSGYLALGYTQDQINAMRAAWKAANAEWAYML